MGRHMDICQYSRLMFTLCPLHTHTYPIAYDCRVFTTKLRGAFLFTQSAIEYLCQHRAHLAKNSCKGSLNRLGRLTDSLTNWQTDKRADRQTDCLSNWLAELAVKCVLCVCAVSCFKFSSSCAGIVMQIQLKYRSWPSPPAAAAVGVCLRGSMAKGSSACGWLL